MSRPSVEAVRRVAVVGAGVVGASWAAYFLAHGMDVAASDPGPGAEDYLASFIERVRPDLARLGLAGNGRLSFHTEAEEAVAGAGFVQENAPEREELKRALLARLDRATPADVIVASSTSSLLRGRMVQDCATPERIIVAHPFNPPHLVPLVELVGDQAATRWAADFYRAIGKRPVTLKREATGHIANRLTAALWREALYILEQGIAEVEDIDAAVAHGPGLRWAHMGPFMTYHLGGGPGGLQHYMEHLGPSQVRRWQDLGMPSINEELTRRAVDGVLREAAGRSIEELERERDEALVRWQVAVAKPAREGQCA